MTEPGKLSDDSELWSRVAHDDQQAFLIIFRRHSDTVCRALAHQLSDWSDAEDVTGAVFHLAWRKRKHARISSEGSVLPWLLVLARNTGRNAARARRRYDGALARLAEHERHRSHHNESRPEFSRLEDALAALPPDQRQAVELCLRDGMTNAEAAELLGVPSGTVKSRVSRGRKRLHSALSEEKLT